MFIPSRDGFLTALQETGHAKVTITATDDLCIVAPTVQKVAREAGIEVRVFATSVCDTLLVMAR